MLRPRELTVAETTLLLCRHFETARRTTVGGLVHVMLEIDIKSVMYLTVCPTCFGRPFKAFGVMIQMRES